MVFKLPSRTDRKLEIGNRLRESHPPIAPENLISVITVVYNNEATLPRCIDSVIGQTWPDIEHIIIDGGSTDGTTDVIRGYANHIDYAVSEPDGGIYAAMNKGISLARGAYVALINSDDWLEPDGLQRSVENMRAHNAEVSIGFAKVWKADGEFSHIWKIGNFDARILTSGMSFCHQALIASRKAYEIVGPFDEKIRISSDYKWIKQLYLSGLKAVFTEEPVVNFSFDGVSAHNRPTWKQECKDMLVEQFPFLDQQDVSTFLEYVYRDGPLDRNAVTNLTNRTTQSDPLQQSLALVLLDKLHALELKAGNVAATAKLTPLKPATPAALPSTGDQGGPDRPKVSVIIPVYNVEAYLETCLRSVMEQSLREIEIICVNDGSPDDSQSILERLASEDPRIRIIVKENGGLSSARNVGIRASRGAYVHMLDSDDYILPGMYERLYDYAETNRLDIVKSDLGYIDDVHPTKRPVLPEKPVFSFEDCPGYVSFISPCATLYSRALLARVSPFPEGLTYEDRPFNWETLLKAERIGHVSEVFYMYRLGRPGSIMSSRLYNIRHFDAFVMVDKIRDILESMDLLEKYKNEFVKEQLRIYSMLIDIDAISRDLYGFFYFHIAARLNADPVDIEAVNRSNLPPRLCALYAFFQARTPDTPQKLTGERYFFHGLNYTKTSHAHAASSCELFLVAHEAIRQVFSGQSLREEDVFRKACLTATIFEHIHSKREPFSVGAVLDLVAALKTYLFENAHVQALIEALHSPAPKPGRTRAQHLGFQYSKSANYQSCRDMLDDYFSTRGANARILEFDDFSLDELPPSVRATYQSALQALKSLGVSSASLSQQTSLRLFLDNHLDLADIRSFTTLFPHSAPERYLIELLRERCAIVFLPHGLAQTSLLVETPDYVLPPTEGEDWGRLFPQSRIIHPGWPECSMSGVSLERGGDIRKEILFLSQIEGGSVHRLDDFVLLSNRFLSAALAMDPARFSFNIRLRKEAELAALDQDLVAEARARAHIRFTTLAGEPMTATRPDLIVSATSTGLLYAQGFGVSCLQLFSGRLFHHWGYHLIPETDRIDVLSDPGGIAPAIDRLLASGTPPLLFETFSAEQRRDQLDKVYQSDVARVKPASDRDRAHPVPEGAWHLLTKHVASSRATWTVSEEAYFESYALLHLHVDHFATKRRRMDALHIRLMRTEVLFGIELREADGAFQLLDQPNPEMIEHDEWGPKITRFFDANGHLIGLDLAETAKDATALTQLMLEARDALRALEPPTRDRWRDVAEALHAVAAPKRKTPATADRKLLFT